MCDLSPFLKSEVNMCLLWLFLPPYNTADEERGFPFCSDHLSQRLSALLLRADDRQDDAAAARGRGRRLDHVPAVFPADAADRLRLCARAGALRPAARADRRARGTDRCSLLLSSDPFRSTAGRGGVIASYRLASVGVV